MVFLALRAEKKRAPASMLRENRVEALYTDEYLIKDDNVIKGGWYADESDEPVEEEALSEEALARLAEEERRKKQEQEQLYLQYLAKLRSLTADEARVFRL
jgi:hypothetical protein